MKRATDVNVHPFILFHCIDKQNSMYTDHIERRQRRKIGVAKKIPHRSVGRSVRYKHTKTKTIAIGIHTYSELESVEWNAIQKSRQFTENRRAMDGEKHTKSTCLCANKQ